MFETHIQDEGQMHNLVTTSLTSEQVSEAKAFGFSWGAILSYILKYGPKAPAIIMGIIAVIRQHTQAETPPSSPIV